MKSILSFVITLITLMLLGCSNNKKEVVQVKPAREVPAPVVPIPEEEEPAPIPEPELPRADPDFGNALSDELSAYFIDAVPDIAEVQVIEENVAVRVTFSDAQLEKWKAELDDEDQQVVGDDIGFYMNEFDDFLDGKVKTIKATQRYLYFKGLGNNRRLVDLEKDSLPSLTWTYIAFNTTREPKLLQDLTSPDSAFIHYINQDITPEVLLEDLDAWNLPREFAQQDSISDADFWQFLIDYRAAADQLNSTLYHRSEIMYYDHSLISKDASRHPLSIVLEREALKKGFRLKVGSGNVYFSQSAALIKDNLLDKLTPEMKAFMDVFLIRYEDGYWDEGLIVSPNQIAELIILWEHFSEIYPDYFKASYAKVEAALLVSFLIQDDVTYVSNFSEPDSVLLPEYRLAMEQVVERIPETASGLKIKEYYDLLSLNEFKNTAAVEEYLFNYREERSSAYKSRDSVK